MKIENNILIKVEESDIIDGTVNIPDSVQIIGEYAFQKCKSLSKINIPSSVKEINEMAFLECESLMEVNISNSVEIIKEAAFYKCKSLAKINIPDSISYIERFLFSGCESLTEINIPDSIESIGIGAFQNCKSLSKINIPNKLSEIQRNSFEGCESLAEINIPDSISNIDICTFKGCKLLTKINLPDTIRSIAAGAFEDCESLTKINIPNSIKSIKTNTFKGCKLLSEINLPDTISYIGNSAFEKCETLTEINIPDIVTIIGSKAFSGCKSLKKVNMPNSLEILRSKAFEGCELLKDLNIPDSVIDLDEKIEKYGYIKILAELDGNGNGYQSQEEYIKGLEFYEQMIEKAKEENIDILKGELDISPYMLIRDFNSPELVKAYMFFNENFILDVFTIIQNNKKIGNDNIEQEKEKIIKYYFNDLCDEINQVGKKSIEWNDFLSRVNEDIFRNKMSFYDEDSKMILNDLINITSMKPKNLIYLPNIKELVNVSTNYGKDGVVIFDKLFETFHENEIDRLVNMQDIEPFIKNPNELEYLINNIENKKIRNAYFNGHIHTLYELENSNEEIPTINKKMFEALVYRNNFLNVESIEDIKNIDIKVKEYIEKICECPEQFCNDVFGLKDEIIEKIVLDNPDSEISKIINELRENPTKEKIINILKQGFTSGDFFEEKLNKTNIKLIRAMKNEDFEMLKKGQDVEHAINFNRDGKDFLSDIVPGYIGESYVYFFPRDEFMDAKQYVKSFLFSPGEYMVCKFNMPFEAYRRTLEGKGNYGGDHVEELAINSKYYDPKWFSGEYRRDIDYDKDLLSEEKESKYCRTILKDAYCSPKSKLKEIDGDKYTFDLKSIIHNAVSSIDEKEAFKFANEIIDYYKEKNNDDVII